MQPAVLPERALWASADAKRELQEWYTPRFWEKIDEGEWNDRARLRFEEEVIELLAVGFAEKRLTGRANHVGARTDREKVADMALASTWPLHATSSSYPRH